MGFSVFTFFGVLFDKWASAIFGTTNYKARYMQFADVQGYSVLQSIKSTHSNKDLSVDFITKLEQTLVAPDSFLASDFDHAPLVEVYNYLTISHDVFLNHWLPKIEQTVDVLNRSYGSQYLAVRVLQLFLDKYRVELVKHIQEEEQVLFAYIDQLLKGQSCPKAQQLSVTHFLNTHNDNVVLHLDALKKDLVLFHQDLEKNIIFQVLFNQLNLFQNELQVHGLIEDQVLIPKVLHYLEKA